MFLKFLFIYPSFKHFLFSSRSFLKMRAHSFYFSRVQTKKLKPSQQNFYKLTEFYYLLSLLVVLTVSVNSFNTCHL